MSGTLGPTANHVDDARASEVDHAVVVLFIKERTVCCAPGGEPPGTPAPVNNHWVDEDGQDNGVDEVSLNFSTCFFFLQKVAYTSKRQHVAD